MIGDTGTVTLAGAVGAFPRSPGDYRPGNEVLLSAVECALADFLGLLRATAAQLHIDDYDVQFGVVWDGATDPLQFVMPSQVGPFVGEPREEKVHFVPVVATLAMYVDDDAFHRDAYELARDCANQAAVRDPIAFTAPNV